MAAFSYQAIDEKGKKVKGVIEGDSERHVRSQLRAKKLKPLDIKSTRASAGAAGKSASSGSSSLFGSPKLNYREVSLVTRQLASLVQSGLPLDEVLQNTAKQTRKPVAKTILLQVRSRVLEGLSLHQAMAEFPKAFDNLYRAMVKAGESSGYLGPVLEQLADYTERSQETRQKLQSAMIYPIIMLIVSVLVVTILMVKVVPSLTKLFERGNQELPGMTTFLIAASDFLIAYGLYLVLGIVAAVVLVNWLLKKESRARKWHKYKLRLPIFGPVILLGETARYASTLGLLATSGVPLLEGLRIATQVLTNKEMKQAGHQVAVAVQEGGSLHKSLDQAEIFPPLLVQMAASGEANGKLADQLLYAARNQEREMEFSINTAMSILQPSMVLGLAGIVVFIIMAILLPIFKMNEMVGL